MWYTLCRTAQVFVAVMGASNYTYAEATLSQGLEDWIMSHVRCFEFLGGVPELIIPDNLKSGVTKACRYEPDLNPTYQQLAEHYDTTVIPARPYTQLTSRCRFEHFKIVINPTV